MEIKTCSLYESLSSNHVEDCGDIFPKELFERIISCLRLGRDDSVIGAISCANKYFFCLTFRIVKQINIDEMMKFQNCLSLDIDALPKPHSSVLIDNLRENVLALSSKISSSKTLFEIKSSSAESEYGLIDKLTELCRQKKEPKEMFPQAKANLPFLLGPLFDTADYFSSPNKTFEKGFSLCEAYKKDNKKRLAEKINFLLDLQISFMTNTPEQMKQRLPLVFKNYCELKSFDSALKVYYLIRDEEDKKECLLFYKNAGGVTEPNKEVSFLAPALFFAVASVAFAAYNNKCTIF